jgi:hypothetical protein
MRLRSSHLDNAKAGQKKHQPKAGSSYIHNGGYSIPPEQNAATAKEAHKDYCCGRSLADGVNDPKRRMNDFRPP